jgi:hypothetical protein
MENASRRYGSDQIKKMIERQKKEYGWEFLFIGANIDAVETAARYGIDKDCAVDYCADSEGTKTLYACVSECVGAVREGRGISYDDCKELRRDYAKRSNSKKHR